MCAACLVAFAALTRGVELGWVNNLDVAVMRWTARSRLPWIAAVAGPVVSLATPHLLILVALIVSLWRARSDRRWAIVINAGIRLALLTVSVLVLKVLSARPSPPLHAPDQYAPLGPLRHVVHAGSSGAFPSGHTTATLVCVALLSCALPWQLSARRQLIVMSVAVAAVSASLVYLDYHWLSDVVGGWLLGTAVLTVPLPRSIQNGQPGPVRK